MFKFILNYILGFYIIQVDGFYIERFINICLKENIFLWGIVRKKSSLITAKIGMYDYERAKEIARNCQTIVEIKRKIGLRFVIEKYKNRKAFFITVIIACIAIFTLSKFVWKVEINSDADINKNEIREELQKEGVKIGALKSKIDSEKIVNDIRLEREDIAWIGIKIEGSKVLVNIVMATKKPEIVNEEEYTNIVAKKDGEIQKIVAKNGTAMCKKGDKVKKGDVLIAGYMQGAYTDRYYVNSMGEVKAKINYTEKSKISKKENKKEETGKRNRKFAIKINNFKINFFKKLSNFKNYDTIYASKKIKIFPNSNFEIEFIKYTLNEISVEQIEHSKEEAKLLGEEEAKKKLNEKISGDIINEKTTIEEYSTYYMVTVEYEVVEDIGTKEKINI